MIPALVDLGSPVNLIKRKYVKGKIKKSNIKLRAANGTVIENAGISTIEFTYKGRRYNEDFIVTDDMTKEIIIGFKFCLKEKAKIDFGQKDKLVLRGEEKSRNEMGEHRIVTRTDEPVAGPLYRLGPELEKEASKIIEKYLKEGVIRESSSPWCSPIVMKKKSNGDTDSASITGD